MTLNKSPFHNLHLQLSTLSNGDRVSTSDNSLDELLGKLRGKTFLQFWDILGRPYKHELPQPVYDYELNIVKLLEQTRYLWILKSVGLGIAEFCLRWILWKCTTNDEWKNRQVPIIVGPNTDLAIKLIKRIRRIFENHNVYFDTKETYLNINDVDLECFSSHHLDSFRSLESPACIYMSEADFFPRNQQQDVRHISERYISKSSPWIIMESTPNAPGGLFETISKEEPCLYTKLRLDYTYGLKSGIYTQQEVDNARSSPAFEREMNLKFLGMVGNTFRTEDIARAQSFLYDADLIPAGNPRTISIDPAWGSSNTGICVTEVRDGRIAVLFADEFTHETSERMVQLVYDLYFKYQPIQRINVDSSQISFIKSLKQALIEELHEIVDYELQIKAVKDNHCNLNNNLIIQPVYFNEQNNKAMLSNVRTLLQDGFLMIDKRFTKLLTGLHTCIDREGRVMKDQVSYDDVIDSLRMCLQSYEIR